MSGWERFVSLAALLAVPVPCAAEPFTVVVLGDTQSYVVDEQKHKNFMAQTKWIAASKASMNIRFVSHVGDIVESAEPEEWARANQAMSVLDIVQVPWSTAFGNHEYNSPDGITSGDSEYLEHFGPDRHEGKTYFGGASDNGRSTWQKFEAGGRTFLHLTLEYDAPGDTLAWAQSVLDRPENQGLPTLVTTHVYLNDNRNVGFTDASPQIVQRVTRPYSGGPGRNSAEQIWQKFIKTNDQIFMVFNGHYAGERLLVSENDAGNEVWQMQVDYSRRPNGGDGWLKLLTFDLDNNQVAVKTYSPVLDEFAEYEPNSNHPLELLDEYTGEGDSVGDGDAAYVIPIDFSARYGAVPEPGIGALVVPAAIAALGHRRPRSIA